MFFTILSHTFPFVISSASSFSTLFSLCLISLWSHISFLTLFTLLIPYSLMLPHSSLMVSPYSSLRHLPHLDRNCNFSSLLPYISPSKLEVPPSFKHKKRQGYIQGQPVCHCAPIHKEYCLQLQSDCKSIFNSHQTSHKLGFCWTSDGLYWLETEMPLAMITFRKWAPDSR